ncbi:MAG: tetratricopeptide repeat protein [Pyrinomonadaceae bacterium]|nr:tetratricopeptide repeat protein [Pyrinomonadaceae bacterium]
MSRALSVSLCLAFLACGSSAVFAQQPNPLWGRIETGIRQKEPGWTLMEIYGKRQHQQLEMFQWRQDEKEIAAWIIVQPSVAKAILHFQEDGFGRLPYKSPPQKLDIGEASYVREARGNAIVVFRRNYVLARISGRASAITTLLRFARHIDALLGMGLDKSKTAYENGETALTEGRYEDAIEELKKAVNQGEGDPGRSQHALGLAYLKLDRREEAIATFKEAIRLRPNFAEAHYDLGRAYYESGEFATAAAPLEEAIRLNPDFFDALIVLGNTYQHSGLHTKSVDVLRKATLLRPDASDAKGALGAAFLLAGQPEEAALVLREVVRLSPRSAFAHASLGQAYRLMGKFQDALNSLQEALRISPADSVAHNYLGLTYLSLDRQQEALAAYRQAILLKSDYAEAHYNLALLQVALGDRNQAQDEYNILRALNSDLADVLLRKLGAWKP